MIIGFSMKISQIKWIVLSVIKTLINGKIKIKITLNKFF